MCFTNYSNPFDVYFFENKQVVIFDLNFILCFKIVIFRINNFSFHKINDLKITSLIDITGKDYMKQ